MKYEIIPVDKVKKYRKYFNPEDFWIKIKKNVKALGKEMLYFVLLLFYTLKDPKTPMKHKILIGGALGYLIFPLDFIPDAVPIIGFSDDFAAIMTVYKSIKASITEENKLLARNKVNELFDKDRKLNVSGNRKPL